MSRSDLPGAVVEPLREVLRSEPNVVRAWWGDNSLDVALDGVGRDVEPYRKETQRLAARVLPILGPCNASFRCGPVDGIVPTARRGIVLYERDDV
jgi:hypothetical protein